MVQKLIRDRRIHSPDVIDAMRRTPRHVFVPSEYRSASYQDRPLDIGEGQTISAPHMVGIMVELLDLAPGHQVLEIGGGSGYHAAIAAQIVGDEGHVYSIERLEGLAAQAKENIAEAGLSGRVSLFVGDGSEGLAEHAPYDRIFVSCAAPYVPEPLIEQMKGDGILLVPVGNLQFQTLLLVRKRGGRVITEDHGGCVFVPLIGRYGFKGLY